MLRMQVMNSNVINCKLVPGVLAVNSNLLLTSVLGCRYASKKSGGSTKNRGNSRLKIRGLKVKDGQYVTAGTILATQKEQLRFLPGLNAGFGRNGTLFAIEHGKIAITTEKWQPFNEHTWVQRLFAGRDLSNVYKRYINILSEPQHNRFKLIDQI